MIVNSPLINTDPKTRKIAEQQIEIDKLKRELKIAIEQNKYLSQHCVCRRSYKLEDESRKLANRLTINKIYHNISS